MDGFLQYNRDLLDLINKIEYLVHSTLSGDKILFDMPDHDNEYERHRIAFNMIRQLADLKIISVVDHYANKKPLISKDSEGKYVTKYYLDSPILKQLELSVDLAALNRLKGEIHSILSGGTPSLSNSSDNSFLPAPIVDSEAVSPLLPKPRNRPVRKQTAIRDLITSETKFEDIIVEFLDDEKVKIYVGAKSIETDYIQMGFANKRKGARPPRKEWILFIMFSLLGGNISWESAFASSKLKQDKSRLAKVLINYFGIYTTPFKKYDKKVGYSFRLRLRPFKDSRYTDIANQYQERIINIDDHLESKEYAKNEVNEFLKDHANYRRKLRSLE